MEALLLNTYNRNGNRLSQWSPIRLIKINNTLIIKFIQEGKWYWMKEDDAPAIAAYSASSVLIITVSDTARRTSSFYGK
jgi:hypothetical protein